MPEFVATNLLILTVVGLAHQLSVEGMETNTSCIPVNHTDARGDILAFFDVTDGYDVTWLHAVNNPVILNQGLSSDVMMLEADVLMRNNMINGTPIMAHPPSVDSNLTLAEFLTQTTASKKGIKLDFKTITVVEPSLKMIQNITSGKEVKNPIWLNADILPGPCYDKVCVPVDHQTFLSLCKRYFPSATLSISWTTGWNVMPLENFYNWSQVLAMGKLVSQLSQPITFPIRASLVRRSWEQIHWLLDLSETFTVTIWSSTRDDLNVQDLVSLRNSVKDKRRIYYDLPPSQSSAFKKAVDSSSGSKGTGRRFPEFPWNAVAAKQCEDVLVGWNSVMFSEDGGFVISKKKLRLVAYLEFLDVRGVVSFIKTGGSDERKSINITLHAELPGEGTTLVLHSDGIFQLSTASNSSKQGSVKSSTSVFKFRISERYCDKQWHFTCEVTDGNDGEGDKASVSLQTSRKPTGSYLIMSSGSQSGAILVQDVEVSLAVADLAPGYSNTGECSPRAHPPVHSVGLNIAECCVCMSITLPFALLFVLY